MRGFVRGFELGRRIRGVFPWTLRGLLVFAIALFALRKVAYASLDFVVLVLGYAALGLSVTSLVAVIVGALVLRAKLEAPVGESRLLAGRFFPTPFRLPALRFVPLLELSAELVVPRFERREEQGRELVRASHRGAFEEVVREVLVRDAFGLAEIRLRLEGGGILALPDLGRLEPSVELLSLSAGDDHAHPEGVPDGDRIELRRYVPGDPARFIHWKIFARSGELVVRMPEHAIKSADRVAVYFVAGHGDEASSAVTLSIARAADLGSRVVLGCDGTDGPLGSSADAERAIARSYGYAGGTAASEFVRKVDASGPAALILIVPAVPGPWLAAATALVRGRPGGARVLVGIDGMNQVASSLARRVLFEPDETVPTTSRRETAKVVAAFRAAGADVILADRISGRMLRDLPEGQRAA